MSFFAVGTLGTAKKRFLKEWVGRLPKNRKRAPSIRDVAQCANVSVSTVSRYLNSSPHISERKRNQISQAIATLNYKPSVVARALNSDKLTSIAVILTDITLFGPMQLIDGIENEAKKRGYLISITLVDGDPHNAKETIDALIMNKPSGCIVIDLDRTSPLHPLISYIQQLLPTAVIDENDPGTDPLALGAYEGGYAITHYLLGLGHRSVIHVSIPENDNEYTRTMGWRQALQDAGAAITPPIATTWNLDSAEQIGRYLASMPDVTAVFAGNDEIAVGIIRGILLSGKSVPGDISVAGFDGNPISAITFPSITTWKQDFTEIGRRAVSQLLDDGDDAIHFPKDADNRYSDKLIIRESTAKPH
ncbi:MAG: LacI family DNA-binding transcriptional regulator [Bifidobacterium sp.]